MDFNLYLGGLSFNEKITFLSQFPLLIAKSRMKNIPLYAIDLIVKIKDNNTVLSLLWRNPENHLSCGKNEYNYYSF